MPDINELDVIPRRILNVFYVLDTSGSMSGSPIATVNSAMAETLDVLRKVAKNNADAQIKVAVLEFSSGCRWMAQFPEDMEDFLFEDLKASGLTDFGKALTELNSKLSRSEFLNSGLGHYLPVIIFMTDGFATDNYQIALAEIQKNKWFKGAMKIGFAIGEAPDVKMISKIVGDSKAVIKTNDLDLFARMLRFVSVTASMIASKTRTTKNKVAGVDIIKEAIDNGMIGNQNLVGDDSSISPQNEQLNIVEDWEDDNDWN